MSKYTKQIIRIKCLELLEINPLDKVTVKDIITLCEMNRNTFYYYYKDIYDVIEDIFIIERDRVRSKQNENTSFYDAYYEASVLFLKYKKAIMHIYMTKNKELIDRYFDEVVNDFVERFTRKQLGNRKISENGIRYIVDFYSSAIISNTMYWIKNGMQDDHIQLIQMISDTYENTVDTVISLCEKNKY